MPHASTDVRGQRGGIGLAAVAMVAIAAAATMLFVAASPARANCYELIGCTNKDYFTAAQLKQLSCQILWEVRNTIYKENGYCFHTKRAIKAFGNAGCQYDDAAKVPLDYTFIKSPIDGQTGNLGVKVGSLVTANQTELTTIARVQPVLVTFTVPAIHLGTIKQHMAGGKLPVTATPQDSAAQPAPGYLTFIDNAVDMTTDTIKLKATFDNPDRRLWPGQFARVSLRLTTLDHATVVPSQLGLSVPDSSEATSIR